MEAVTGYVVLMIAKFALVEAAYLYLMSPIILLLFTSSSYTYYMTEVNITA